MRNIPQLRHPTTTTGPPLEGPKLETESMDMDRDCDRKDDQPTQLPVLHPYGTRQASGIQTTKRPYPEYLMNHTRDLRRRQEYQRIEPPAIAYPSSPTPACLDDQVSIDNRGATYFQARSSDGGAASACKIDNGHGVVHSFNGNRHIESMQVSPMDESFSSDLELSDYSFLNLPTRPTPPSTSCTRGPTLLPGLRLPATATTTNRQRQEMLQTGMPIPASAIEFDSPTATHDVFNLFAPGPNDGSSTLSNSDPVDPDDFMRDVMGDIEALFEYANNPFSFDFQHHSGQSTFPAWETNVRRPRTRMPDVTEQSVSQAWSTSTNHNHSGQPARVAEVRPRSRSLPPTASRSPSPDTLKIPEPPYMKNEGREVPVVPLAHAHAAAAASNGDDGHPQSAATPTANGNAATAPGPGYSPSNVLNIGVGQGQGMAAVGVAGVEQIRAVINTGFSHFMAHVNGKFAHVRQKLDAIERRQLSMSEERQRADERGNSSISAKLEELDKKFNDMHEELKALKPIVIDRVQVLADKLDNVEAKVIETKQSIMETIDREQDKFKEIISSKLDPKMKDKSEPEPASSTLVVPMQAIDQHDLGAAAAALDVPVSSVSTSQGGSNNADHPENVGRKNAIIVVRRATNSLRGSASVPGVQNQKNRGNSNVVPSAPSELVSFRMPSAPAPSAPTRRGRGRPSRKRSPSLNSVEAFKMKTAESGVASPSLVMKDASNNGGGIRRGRPRIGSDTKIVAGIDHTGIYGHSDESYGRLTRSKSIPAAVKRLPNIGHGSTRRRGGKGASGTRTHGFVLRRRVQPNKA